MSLPDQREPIINDIVLQSGGYFSETRDNEVIVNAAFARRHGIHPGQTIHLILNNRRQELHVVGTAISSEFVYLVAPGSIAPDPEHFGVFYLKRTFAEEVFDFGGATNQIVGRLDPIHRGSPQDILRRMETMLAPYGVATSYAQRTQSSNQFLSDEIRGLGMFSTIMPAVFLAVAALVLNVLMVRLIDQQRVIIGTFKALGYADSQIFMHYTKFALVLGLASGLVGLGLGYLMADFVTSMYRMFYEFPEPGESDLSRHLRGRIGRGDGLRPGGVAASGAGGLAAEPGRGDAGQAAGRRGRIWLEKLPWLWRRLSFGWRLVLRNVFRNPLRSSVGIFATAMGAGLLVTGFILSSAINYLIDFQFQLVTRSDVDLRFKDERGLGALLEARRLPGVDRAEPTFDVSCTFINGSHRRRGRDFRADAWQPD